MAANVFGLPPGEQHERWLAEVAPSFREGKAASMVVDGTLFSRRG